MKISKQSDKPFFIILLAKKDVVPESGVENPGLLGHVCERPANCNAPLQQGHLQSQTAGRLCYPMFRIDLVLQSTNKWNRRWERRAEVLKTGFLTCPKIAEISEVFPLPTLPQIPTSFPYRESKKLWYSFPTFFIPFRIQTTFSTSERTVG